MVNFVFIRAYSIHFQMLLALHLVIIHHHVRSQRLKEIIDFVFSVVVIFGKLLELIFSLDLLSFFLQSLLLTNYKLFNIVFFINLLALVTVVDRSVNFVLNYIIFDTFVHHIEAVFNIIFGPSRHLLNNFCPFVSYLQSFFKKLDILFK